MYKKSHIATIGLTLVVMTLISGYSIRTFNITQPFRKNNAVYAADVPILYDLIPEKEKSSIFEKLNPFFKKPQTLEEKIESLSVSKKEVKKVENYLLSINAPLWKKAKFFVQAAKYYKIDYRLVAAISVVESGGGKNAYRPYNAWGWGGSGNARTFKNWEEGIITVSQSMHRYAENGARSPIHIAPTYNPVTPKEWAGNVSYVMSKMK